MKRVLIVLAAGVALVGSCPACALDNPGFESTLSPWIIQVSAEPGATGEVHHVRRADDREGVHGGEAALRFQIRGSGATGTVAWASAAQVLPCVPGRRLQVGCYARSAAALDPVIGERMHLELRVEFFRDPEGTIPIPSHVSIFRTPLTIPGDDDGSAWIPVVTSARTPPAARSVQVSVVLWGVDPPQEPAMVWIDDLAMRTVDPGQR